MSNQTPNYVDKNELLRELISKQLKNVQCNKKLQYTDLKRICKYINRSIFDENKCCVWNGYITNENNTHKGTYINFFYKKKKIALHRLLYINFVDNLCSNEYLKFSCDNKGKCCNLHHLKKFKYQQFENNKDHSSKTSKENKKEKYEEEELSLFLEFE